MSGNITPNLDRSAKSRHSKLDGTDIEEYYYEEEEYDDEADAS